MLPKPLYLQIIITFICLHLCVACNTKTGAFFDSGSDSNSNTDQSREDYLVLISGDVNHSGITLYDLAGTFVTRLADFRTTNAIPRGLGIFDSSNLIISTDTPDALHRINVDGTSSMFHFSGTLTGNIYDVDRDSKNNVYVVETNNIEVINSTGSRINPVVSSGSCVISSPRGIHIVDDFLYVANQGGTDQIHQFQINSNGTFTCIASINVGAINPYGVLKASDGYIYFTSQTNHQVYRLDSDLTNLTTIWTTNTAVINLPTSIIEHPEGDLLISSTNNDSIERIDTSGNLVGTGSFIKSPDSLNVSDIAVWAGNQ